VQTAAALPVIICRRRGSYQSGKRPAAQATGWITQGGKADEAMIKSLRKGTDTMRTLSPPETSESPPEKEKARCALNSLQNVEDLIPYSAKDLKYMWVLWDEAHRYHSTGLRYWKIYAGALGIFLAGWLSSRMGLSFSAPLGGILMLAGAFIGVWYCLKSLRHKGHSAREG